ncbi:MAG: phage tail protein [Clostridia bacterium]|nr:phage tail protein [Clostridia bacterium]
MKSKKPMIKETVGALYLAFNTPDENGEFDSSTYEETIKSDIVKNIATTENAESTVVRASGQDYKTVNQTSSIEMAVEVVAFDPATLARMRGDDTSDSGGLMLSGAPSERPFFGFGKVVKKVGGGVQYAWYPKCQLVENTDDIATSEDTFSEQNDTITIRAYSFNNADQKKTYVDSETPNYPQGLTEEGFFTKPIINAEDLANAAGASV